MQRACGWALLHLVYCAVWWRWGLGEATCAQRPHDLKLHLQQRDRWGERPGTSRPPPPPALWTAGLSLANQPDHCLGPWNLAEVLRLYTEHPIQRPWDVCDRRNRTGLTVGAEAKLINATGPTSSQNKEKQFWAFKGKSNHTASCHQLTHDKRVPRPVVGEHTSRNISSTKFPGQIIGQGLGRCPGKG